MCFFIVYFSPVKYRCFQINKMDLNKGTVSDFGVTNMTTFLSLPNCKSLFVCNIIQLLTIEALDMM